MIPCSGNHGWGETTTSGTARATRNIRSRMNSPAEGCTALGNKDEITTMRSGVIPASAATRAPPGSRRTVRSPKRGPNRERPAGEPPAEDLRPAAAQSSSSCTAVARLGQRQLHAERHDQCRQEDSGPAQPPLQRAHTANLENVLRRFVD